MIEAPEKKEGKVRYKRHEYLLDEEETEGLSLGERLVEVRRNLTPSFVPLVIGFAVLLAIVASLGVLSENEIQKIKDETTNLQFEQTEKFAFFNDVSRAFQNLKTEARIRAAGRQSGDLMPPFELKLNNARNELRDLFPAFNRVKYQSEEWQALRAKLEEFVKATEDLDSWETKGFITSRDIENKNLEAVEKKIGSEQDNVNKKVESLTSYASSRVRTLWISALGIGMVVVTVMLLEVQRRYKQTQRSNKAARRERLFNAQMLEGMVSAVAAIDSEGRVRSANEPFFDIFPDIDVGEEFQENENAEIKARLVAAANMMPIKASAYRGRWTLDHMKTERGISRTFDLYVSPLKFDGETGHIITLVDVTDAVETENELRRNTALAAVGQATAQVAHEIRNPLGSIKLGISLLRGMTDSKDATSTMDLIDRGIDHLQKLVVDVTQFSRQRPLKPTQTDLYSLLEESLELVASNIDEKQTPIEKFYTRENLMGEFDEDQLRQVFVNLLANAIDASETGSPIAITTNRVERDVEDIFASTHDGITPTVKKPYVQVVITDRGSGMDEETKKRVFEPFFSTKARGTGLGLAIVKQIVDRHEGTIEIKSEVGVGTSFTIELPLSSRNELTA